MPAPDPIVFRADDHRALLELLENLAAPARHPAPLSPLSVQLDRLAAIRRKGRAGTGRS